MIVQHMLCKTGIMASPLYKYLKYEELKMYWGEGDSFCKQYDNVSCYDWLSL